MRNQPTIQRVVLAVEDPALREHAHQYCEGMIPGVPRELLSLDEFAESLDMEPTEDELRVLMLHANEHGQLDSGTPIVRSIISSRAPVLVIRKSAGGEIPDTHVKRVVVPLDGTAIAGQAIPIASRVAQSLKVPVQFIMVIDPSRVIPPAYAYDPDAWAMIEALRQTSHWALSQAEAEMARDGVVSGSDLLFGSVNASLMERIVEGDLVVMTTHGPGLSANRSRESITLRTLVSVPQPMLIMQAQPETPIVVDGFLACSWAEPLHNNTSRTA